MEQAIGDRFEGVQGGGGGGGGGQRGQGVLECLTAACKAFSLVNAKGKGIDELVIRSLDD
jgi:hypothetical protein